jgi:uncharacterized membrane protein YuzA (DUF378 family)
MSNLKVLYSFPLWITRAGGIPKTGYHQVAGLVKQGVQTANLFFILIGLCGVMPLIISDENSRLLIKANAETYNPKANS